MCAAIGIRKRNRKTIDTLRAVPLAGFQEFPATTYTPNGSLLSGLGNGMIANRRKNERRECRRGAKIQFGVGSLPRDCMITDISAGGVKVVAEQVEIPPEFTIIFSSGGPRQCRLAWRIGYEFGAEFVD